MKVLNFLLILIAFQTLLWAGTKNPAVDADMDGDGRIESVHIRPKTGKEPAAVVVARKKAALYTGVRLNPWKVLAPDVDGDGRHEVAVGVYKKSRFDPVMAKRLFIYKFEGGKLLPKWLGSRLSRRFTDFTFKDLDKDGRDELIAQEYDNKNRYQSIYRWNGFGFDFIKDKKIGGKSK